jgi:hypothetical protein
LNGNLTWEEELLSPFFNRWKESKARHPNKKHRTQKSIEAEMTEIIVTQSFEQSFYIYYPIIKAPLSNGMQQRIFFTFKNSIAAKFPPSRIRRRLKTSNLGADNKTQFIYFVSSPA